MYTKVTDPTCGVLMPIGGDPLSEDELTCLNFWISGLLPPGEGCDDCVCDPGEVESCYSGLEGTADVGECASGTHTCLTSGTGWTACEGEALPRGEDCYTPDIDENCDGFTPECSETWALGFGDPDDDSMRGVAVDGEGNVFGFGDFETHVSFGGDPLTAELSDPPKPDIVITKHDQFGNFLWSKNWGDNSTQLAVKLTIDDDGNLVGLVRMYGGIDMGGGEIIKAVGGMEIFAFKLDNDGNHIWSQMVGGPDKDRSERMVIDSNGDIIFTGTFSTEATFGTTMFVSAGLRDAFVMKLDGATGEIIFVNRYGGVGDDYGFGIDVDDADNIIVAGRFTETLDIGMTNLVSAGGRDVFLAQFTPDGDPMWARSYGGTGDDEVHDLKRQPNGNLVMMGGISDSVDFGGGALVSEGSRDVFAATFDATGEHIWSSSWGDENDQFETDGVNTWLTMMLDPNGHIYIGGPLYGALVFDGGTVLSASGEDPAKPDAFYFELEEDGGYVGGRRFGGAGTDVAYNLAVTDTHVVLVGRSTGTSIDFDTGIPLYNVDGSDAFIAKVPKAP